MVRERILVVDDEAPMRKYLSANLRARGYEVLTASDGTEALKLAAEHPLDLIILDIMMPGPDGLSVLPALRRDLEIPILMLSARGREGDKVSALDQGADDYLTKPFGVAELLARVRAALRRAGAAQPGTAYGYQFGGLSIDFGTREVRTAGTPVRLTPREFDVLAHLARNAGRVLTHRQILQAVWGGQYSDEAEYLWTYVRRLRRKIEPQPRQPRYLLTEPGVGYRLPAPESTQDPSIPLSPA
jgi:two-component system KDP operon response regulator KdpE